MKIATWNINGVKARLEGAVTWLKETSPDVACFQEIKCVNEAFPTEPFEELGYNVAVHGQKGFNGVAILSKRPFDEVTVRGLPGDEADNHARYIEVVVPHAGGIVRVGNLYLPNGNPIGTDKFAYKLAWMQRLREHARSAEAGGAVRAARRLQRHPRAGRRQEPAGLDRRRPVPARDACGLPLASQSWPDGCHPRLPPGSGVFTFWDYQAGAWQKDHGIRIDHILASPQAADRLVTAGIDKFTRGWEKPSDHVPVWVELDAD